MRFFIVIACMITSNSMFGQDVLPPLPPNPIPSTVVPAPILSPPVPYASQWGTPNGYARLQPLYGAGNMTTIDYLGSDYMRKQVDFSDDQNNDFMKLRNEYLKAFQSVVKKYPELYEKQLPLEDRKVIIKKLQADQTKLRKRFSEEAEEILVPHQISLIKSMRFKQSVQMNGLTQTITNSPFQEDFDTTEKQRKELAKIRVEAQKAIQQKMLEMQKEVEKMRVDAKEKMLKLLTEKQKKLLDELEGENKSKNGNRSTRL